LALDQLAKDTLLGRTPDEAERALAGALDRWAPSAPGLDTALMRLGEEEHPLKRRLGFWEALAAQSRAGRQRQLEAVIGAAYREDTGGLRLLFSFLCGKPRSYLYPERIASLRHAERLARRLLFLQPPRTDEELAWLEALQALLASEQSAPFPAALGPLRTRLAELLADPAGLPSPLPAALAELIRLEGRAASLRGARLVDQVGEYDPVALARLLPLVVALDEWQGDLQALVSHGARGLKHPLEQFLGEDELAGWQRELAVDERLPARLLAGWVRWMSETEMVGNEPAAWVGLLRTLGGRRYRKTLYAALLLPLRWRARRLGLDARPPQSLFRGPAVSEGEGLYWVDLDALLWADWVSADGRPSSPEDWRSPESPLALLRSRIQDDAFCELILDNPKWSGRNCTVEIIARGSRSVKILLRIARERRLHSGAANRGVPLALLENPTGIPLSALRAFLGPRYISHHDIGRLARGSSGVRQEIVREARELIKRG
jgi:hypothetical protein